MQFGPSTAEIGVLQNLRDDEYLSVHFPMLNVDDVSSAAENLEALVSVTTESRAIFSRGLKDARLDTEFRNAIMFKRRPVGTCTLLHFAMWFVAEFGVESALIKQALNSRQNQNI